MYITMIKCWIFLVLLFLVHCQGNDQSNIVFIVADDMGNNDIGYNNPEIQSPNIDRLANSGVILDSNYVYHLCTPSRAAFMTGRYTYKLGLQHYVIRPYRPAYVKRNFPMIAEMLKQYGYRTHLIGKWHLGYCKQSITPTRRGFDYFYGLYNGKMDYYTYKSGGFKDFRYNFEAIDPKNTTGDEIGYATLKYAAKVEEVLDEHNATYRSKPFFMYISFTAPHSPLQAPTRHLSMYSGEYEYTNKSVKHQTNRTTFYALVSALDEAVGRIYNKLDTLGYLSNTIIAFTSDNGGDPLEGGFNNPYRGTKDTFYEGGIRVPGFVYSENGAFIKEKGYRTKELFHATDWFPTFLSLAGGRAELENIDIDGKDQTLMLKLRQSSARDTIIINMDEHDNASTVYGIIKKVDDDIWKYVEGNIGSSSEVYKAIPVTRKKRMIKRNLSNLKENLQRHMQRHKRAIADRYLFKISDDETESTNLYSSTSPLPIQTKLESEIEAEKQNITALFAWKKCKAASILAQKTGWWTSGSGEQGWCVDNACERVTN